MSSHGVPDLELDLLALDVDHARAELDADGEVVHGLKPLVSELEQEAGLANAWKETNISSKCSYVLPMVFSLVLLL